jgi:methyl-accepting chemotaxis protein
VTRRNDEFDGLATSLNQMLDRIEQLIAGDEARSPTMSPMT